MGFQISHLSGSFDNGVLVSASVSGYDTTDSSYNHHQFSLKEEDIKKIGIIIQSRLRADANEKADAVRKMLSNTVCIKLLEE